MLGSAFLTGSRVYGVPNESSDADVVVSLTLDEIHQLVMLADEAIPFDENSEYHGNGCSIRFGKLNLIVVRDDREYEKWYECTKFCVDMMYYHGKKLSKEESARVFRARVDHNMPLEEIQKLYFPEPTLMHIQK